MQVDKTDKVLNSSFYILSETVLHAHVCINKDFTAWGQEGIWKWMSFVKLSPIYATKETHGIRIFQYYIIEANDSQILNESSSESLRYESSCVIFRVSSTC